MVMQQDMFKPASTISQWSELKWFGSDEHKNIEAFLNKMDVAGKRYCPPRANIYDAFNLTPLETVKVVIIGQDPYPTPGHAIGLAFSVASGVMLPGSLRNIYLEMSRDIGCYPPDGNLTHWAKQGVLLLNTILTCDAGYSMSHQGIGWERLSLETIRAVINNTKNVAFICWGAKARDALTEAAERDSLEVGGHLVFSSAHPSPRSAHTGFFGSSPFSTVNQFLKKHGKDPIQWC